MTPPPTKVSAEPVRRAIEGWLARNESPDKTGWKNYQHFSPLQQLVFQVWEEEDTKGSGFRTIHRLLERREGRRPARSETRQGEPYRQEYISFDIADLILTKLGLRELWDTDPVLSKEYQEVDLARLDRLSEKRRLAA